MCIWQRTVSLNPFTSTHHPSSIFWQIHHRSLLLTVCPRSVREKEAETDVSSVCLCVLQSQIRSCLQSRVFFSRSICLSSPGWMNICCDSAGCYKRGLCFPSAWTLSRKFLPLPLARFCSPLAELKENSALWYTAVRYYQMLCSVPAGNSSMMEAFVVVLPSWCLQDYTWSVLLYVHNSVQHVLLLCKQACVCVLVSVHSSLARWHLCCWGRPVLPLVCSVSGPAVWSCSYCSHSGSRYELSNHQTWHRRTQTCQQLSVHNNIANMSLFQSATICLIRRIQWQQWGTYLIVISSITQ